MSATNAVHTDNTFQRANSAQKWLHGQQVHRLAGELCLPGHFRCCVCTGLLENWGAASTANLSVSLLICMHVACCMFNAEQWQTQEGESDFWNCWCLITACGDLLPSANTHTSFRKLFFAFIEGNTAGSEQSLILWCWLVGYMQKSSVLCNRW